MRTLAIVLAVTVATPGAAQLGGLGAVGGLGGGLSGIGKAGVGNATGLLGYCVKNKLTAATGAQGVLGKLTGRPAVTQSPDYGHGLMGHLVTPADAKAKPLSLDSLPGGLRTKACDLVLKRAGSFL